jgi:hypothetical protein
MDFRHRDTSASQNRSHKIRVKVALNNFPLGSTLSEQKNSSLRPVRISITINVHQADRTEHSLSKRISDLGNGGPTAHLSI